MILLAIINMALLLLGFLAGLRKSGDSRPRPDSTLTAVQSESQKG